MRASPLPATFWPCCLVKPVLAMPAPQRPRHHTPPASCLSSSACASWSRSFCLERAPFPSNRTRPAEPTPGPGGLARSPPRPPTIDVIFPPLTNPRDSACLLRAFVPHPLVLCKGPSPFLTAHTHAHTPAHTCTRLHAHARARTRTHARWSACPGKAATVFPTY